jgi:hypothetical protein
MDLWKKGVNTSQAQYAALSASLELISYWKEKDINANKKYTLTGAGVTESGGLAGDTCVQLS